MEIVKSLYLKTVNKQVEGVGVIEIILILVILIGLVLIFRDQIAEIVNEAFASITSDASGIATDITITP